MKIPGCIAADDGRIGHTQFDSLIKINQPCLYMLLLFVNFLLLFYSFLHSVWWCDVKDLYFGASNKDIIFCKTWFNTKLRMFYCLQLTFISCISKIFRKSLYFNLQAHTVNFCCYNPFFPGTFGIFTFRIVITFCKNNI